MNAIRLTGENGSDGEDGSLYEYIYRRQNQNQVLPIKPDNEQQDNYIPSGWNNHPEGIDQYNRYEYICYRTKDKSTNQWNSIGSPEINSLYSRSVDFQHSCQDNIEKQSFLFFLPSVFQ